MNDRQNTVVATTIVSLILVVVFLCPWRVESSGDLAWSPLYQPPLTYERTFDPGMGRQGGARIASEDAQIAVEILVLEVLAVGAAGGILYVLAADSAADDDSPSRSIE